MILSRRLFIKLISGIIASLGLKNVPKVVQKIRKPYVTKGTPVSYIGPAGTGFMGGRGIKSIKEWDGIGYPVEVYENSFRSPIPTETYYDHDLMSITDDIPDRFWHTDTGNRDLFPNVQTWARMKRFGESSHEAIRSLGYSGTNEWLVMYPDFYLYQI